MKNLCEKSGLRIAEMQYEQAKEGQRLPVFKLLNKAEILSAYKLGLDEYREELQYKH